MEIIFWNEKVNEKVCHLKTKDLLLFQKSQKKKNFRKNKIPSKANQNKQILKRKIAKIEIDVNVGKDERVEYELRIFNFSGRHSNSKESFDDFLILKKFQKEEKPSHQKVKMNPGNLVESEDRNKFNLEPRVSYLKNGNTQSTLLANLELKRQFPFANFNQKWGNTWNESKLGAKTTREKLFLNRHLLKRHQISKESLIQLANPIKLNYLQMSGSPNGKFKLFKVI